MELSAAVEKSGGFVVDRATDFEHVKRDWSGLGILICDQSTRETVAWLGTSIGWSKLIPLLELFLWVIADDQDSRSGKDKVIDFVAQLRREFEERKGREFVERDSRNRGNGLVVLGLVSKVDPRLVRYWQHHVDGR